MPLLRLTTSVDVADDLRAELLAQLSATTAKLLGKPESYMMVIIDAARPMLLGGGAAPAALIEVRSVGSISGDQARALIKGINEVLGGTLGLPADRVYGNFDGVEGAMWGYNNSTLG
jgi:phenylpyruvate tautomerase